MQDEWANDSKVIYRNDGFRRLCKTICIIDYKGSFNDFSKSEEVDKHTFEYTNNYIPRQERQTDIFEFFK